MMMILRCYECVYMQYSSTTRKELVLCASTVITISFVNLKEELHLFECFTRISFVKRKFTSVIKSGTKNAFKWSN